MHAGRTPHHLHRPPQMKEVITPLSEYGNMPSGLHSSTRPTAISQSTTPIHMSYADSASNTPMNISTSSATPAPWSQVHSPKPPTSSLLQSIPSAGGLSTSTTARERVRGRESVGYSDPNTHEAHTPTPTPGMEEGEYGRWVLFLHCQAAPEDILPHCRLHGSVCGYTVTTARASSSVFVRYVHVCVYMCMYIPAVCV